LALAIQLQKAKSDERLTTILGVYYIVKAEIPDTGCSAILGRNIAYIHEVCKGENNKQFTHVAWVVFSA